MLALDNLDKLIKLCLSTHISCRMGNIMKRGSLLSLGIANLLLVAYQEEAGTSKIDQVSIIAMGTTRGQNRGKDNTVNTA